MSSENGGDLKAFVIMPFGEEGIERETFTACYDLFKAPLEQLGFAVTRSDEITSAQEIMADIVIEIRDSNLIIADLTDTNPNVMYELGVAHALRKPTIVLTQNELETLPFDTKHYRTIRYHSDHGYMQDACQQIHKLAMLYLNDTPRFHNIVCRSLGYDVETYTEWKQQKPKDSKLVTGKPRKRQEYGSAARGHRYIAAGEFSNRVTSSADFVWRDNAGAQYEFEVRTIRARLPSVAGVYIYAMKVESDQDWKAVYVGSSDNLGNLISVAHPMWIASSAIGATHVHYAVVHDRVTRFDIAQRLVAALRPSLNS